MRSLALVEGWPVGRCAVRVVSPDGTVAAAGDLDDVVALASVTKLLAAWSILVAVEEGSLHLDDPAGPPGSTLRHLLAHTSGLAFDSDEVVAAPATRRIYSNQGFDVAAHHLEAGTGLDMATYLHEAVLGPLGMKDTELRGSAAKDGWGSADDLGRFALELLRPRLLDRTTVTDAVTAQWPDLDGVVPGVGEFRPCPWGLGPELKGTKHPHWMGSRTAVSTFGHFGGSGTFIWVDPTHDLACVMLSDTGFDRWGLTHWPTFNDALVDEWSSRS